jgi:hypothetical protein
MKLKIKFITSDSIEFEFNGSTINDLKDKICDIRKVDKTNIKLIFAGKILENNKTLESYNIIDGRTVHCLIKKSTSPSNDKSSDVPLPDINNQNIPSPDINNLFNNMQIPNFLGGIPTSQQIMDMYTNNPQMQQMMNNMIQNPQMRTMLVNMTLQKMNLPPDSPMRSMYEQMFTNLLSNPDQFINIMGMFSEDNQDMVDPTDLQNMMNMFNTMNIQPNNNSTYASVPETTNISNPGPNDTASTTQASVPETVNTSVPETVNTPHPEPNDTATTQVSVTTGLPVLTPPLTQPLAVEKYSEQIEQIKNMGFEDESKIIEILEQSCGSVSIALNKLLN